MRLLAPAKINLHLRVAKPRADGFHPIVSWMCTVALFDKLTFERFTPSPDSGLADSLSSAIDLRSDWPELPSDATNLVSRAAEAFVNALGPSQPPCEAYSVLLSKRIPLGAGLGGGSSDGACTLRALNQLWKAHWPAERLAELSATLGSDLPFFFHAPSAICHGRGERVQTISSPRPRAALLLLPARPMPTPAVYRRFDELTLGTDLTPEPDWIAWATLPALDLLPRLVNDLEAAAFSIDPQLGKLRNYAEQLLGRPVRMSGSGSSLYTLFDTIMEARKKISDFQIAERLSAKALAVELAPAPNDDLNEVQNEQ